MIQLSGSYCSYMVPRSSRYIPGQELGESHHLDLDC